MQIPALNIDFKHLCGVGYPDVFPKPRTSSVFVSFGIRCRATGIATQSMII